MEEALDCCDRCLAFDSNNAGVKTVKERVVKAKEIKDKKEKAKEERLRQEAEAKHQMNLAFRVSGNMRIVKHTFLIGIRP